MDLNSVALACIMGVLGLWLWDKLTKPHFASEILKACLFAAAKHAGQRRKNAAKDLYITHPIRVSQIISDLGGQGDNLYLLQAGLLHDTVEDTDTTLWEIEREFGGRVSQIVAQHTDDKSLPKEEQKRRQVASAPNLTYEAKILVLSDKIANMEDLLLGNTGANIPVGWSVERVRGYVGWAMEVAKGTGLDNGHPLMSRLRELAAGQFEYFDGKKYSAIW